MYWLQQLNHKQESQFSQYVFICLHSATNQSNNEAHPRFQLNTIHLKLRGKDTPTSSLSSKFLGFLKKISNKY